jgi:hypothetical protein
VRDGPCCLESEDYCCGEASTETSGVSVGFTVALGVAVALPLTAAEGDAVSVATGVADGVVVSP